MNFNFSVDEYEALKKIITITRNIKAIYNNLYELEIHNKKNSNEYEKNLEKLKYYLNEESTFYEDIIDDLDKVYDFCDYIYPEGYTEFEDELNIIINNHETDLIRTRIINKLNSVIDKASFINETNYNVEKENVDDEILEELTEQLSDEELEKLLQFLSNEKEDNSYMLDVTLKETIINDISNTILAILRKISTNEKYSKLNSILNKIKYNYSYLNNKVEEGMLNNNFEIAETLYWEANFVASLQNRGNTFLLNTLNDYKTSLLSKYTFVLLHQVDDYNDTLEKRKNIIFSEIIIRAVLLFSSNYEIINYKKSLDLDVLLLGKKDELVENAILEIFREYNDDQKLPNILTFYGRQRGK